MRLKHEILGFRVGLGGCEEGNLLGVLVICLKSIVNFTVLNKCYIWSMGQKIEYCIFHEV